MVEFCRNNTDSLNTVSDIFVKTCDFLKDITIDFEIEACELCSKFLKKDKPFLHFSQDIVVKADCIALQDALSLRVKGVPLQYILGEWDFYGKSFIVGEGVLIPRADTETLIDAVLDCQYITDFVKNSDNILNVLDICSGSGCIAITLERELSKILKNTVNVTAIEKSEIAFEFLTKNIELHKSNVQTILYDALDIDNIKLNEFDIIVSNPPYIKPCDITMLQKEVSFEPYMALDGGDDGLFFYRELTKKYSSLLKNNGQLFFEIGFGQEFDVKEILIENNLKNICFYNDMCGIIRIVSATK